MTKKELPQLQAKEEDAITHCMQLITITSTLSGSMVTTTRTYWREQIVPRREKREEKVMYRRKV